MSDFVSSAPPDTVGRKAFLHRALIVFCVAALALMTSAFRWGQGTFSKVLFIGGVALLITLAALLVGNWKAWRGRATQRKVLSTLIELENAPCFIADHDGRVHDENAAAVERFNQAFGQMLDHVLRGVLPNPKAVLCRLQAKAHSEGRAQERVVIGRGTVQVSVRRVEDFSIWRIDTDRLTSWSEGLRVPLLTIGRDGRILQMNTSARELLGDNSALSELLSPETPVKFGEIVRIGRGKGRTLVVPILAGTSGGAQDILLAPVNAGAAEHGSTSFAELPVPLMRLSPTGQILEANRLATELVGGMLSEDSMIEQVMQGLGRPIGDWLRETLEQAAAPRSEFLRLNRPDKEMFVQVTLSRVTRDGEVGLIAVLNDATELKTLEAQFVQSQKMQAVGQLAGGVAHDFNNLLTAISGHCDLLLLRHDQSDPDYGDLVQINQNANRAAALVSQLLAFSRKQTLRPEMLDLRDTLSDLTHLLNRLVGEKITLTLSHDPVLKPVRADKRQLEQVLMNLVVNARDAMPDGGQVRIETEVVALDQPLARDRAVLPAGDYVLVKVIDEGVGIAPDKLQKVFEPFFTTKRTGEGTGLGLSTVYGIVKQTGGFIFVDSIVGKGTEFLVYLPVSPSNSEPEVKDRPRGPENATYHGEGVVLLVEDEAPVRAFASRALRLRGYTVLEAGSAEEALQLLADKDLVVDVFVTDVVMPGIDGPTWVRKAKAERPDVRVVFMSGYAEGAFGDSGPEIPDSVFLPKPFSLNQLTETVYQQMS